MTESRPNIVLVAIAGLACLLLIVGAVGTWQVVDVTLGSVTASASATGVEHGSDGPIVIGMAVIAGVMLLCYVIVPGQPSWAVIVALVIAALALLTTVADTIDVADRTFRSPGWGLYLDVAASVVLTVTGALLVRESVVHGRAVRAARPVAPWPAQQQQTVQQTAPTQPFAPAQPAAAVPAGWHHDPWSHRRLRYWDGTQWTGHTAD